MKKIILTALLSGVLMAGGIAALKIRPDLRFRAGSFISELTKETELPEKTDISAQAVPVSRLEEYGAEMNSCMMLVNDEYHLPEDFSPDIVYYKDTDVLFERHTAAGYSELAEQVNERFGDKLYVSSTFRTVDEQKELYSEMGPEVAQKPMASEHLTGLAADVYVNGYAGESFIKCPAGQFVNKSCGDYGFIIRYPDRAKKITGIDYEPWHLRYVGQPHAGIIMKNGLTLEEYEDMFEKGSFYRSGDYVISCQQGEELMLPEGAVSCEVSPDNRGGWFVTALMK